MAAGISNSGDWSDSASYLSYITFSKIGKEKGSKKRKKGELKL